MSELVLSCFPGLGLLDHAFEAEGYCVVRGPDPLWNGVPQALGRAVARAVRKAMAP